MKIGAFEIHEPVPELRDPHAFAMVRPWVDVGSVGTLTLNRLERFLGSKELGKLERPGNFFDFTRYRPTIKLVKGVREVKVPNSIVRYAKTENGPDYLFLHLLEPHSNGEDYTDSILEVVKYFGIKRYCRVGAMYDAVPHTRPLLITGSLGSVPQIKEVPHLKLRGSNYQGPTTIMNLLSEGIEKADIETINFMVHLPQYVQLEEDYTGASRMIEALSSVYSDIPADLAPVRRGQRQYRELNATVERNSELKDLIHPPDGSILRRAVGFRGKAFGRFRARRHPIPGDRTLPQRVGRTSGARRHPRIVVRRTSRPSFGGCQIPRAISRHINS